jgi:hypothetical protein
VKFFAKFQKIFLAFIEFSWYNLFVKRKKEKKFMENNFVNTLSGIYSKELTISGKNIKQNERNTLKAELMEAFAAHLNDMFNGSDVLEVGVTTDGVAVNIQNESIGSLVVVFNATIKNLEYDFDFEKEEYEKETNEKAMKKAERLAAKEKKIKETAETKERKMKEKEKKA